MTRILVALHTPAFRQMWFGALVSSIGSMMYLTALGWVTATTTGSALKVTVVSFVGLLPLLALSPVAGALADRHSRRRLLAVTIAIQMAVGIGLAIAVTLDAAPYPVLVAFAVAGGSAGALTAPVFQAMLPTLVPSDALRNAVVLNSMQFNISRAVGPMVAGLLIDAVGPSVVFWCNAASFLAVLVALARIGELPPRAPRTIQRSVLGDVGAAIRYVRGTPGLRIALGTAGLMALLAGPIQWLAPILATEALELDAARFGLLLGAYGAGAIAGGVGLLVFDRGVPYRWLALGGVTVATSGLFALGLAPGFVVAVLAMGGLGTGYLITSTSLNSSLQAQLDDRVRGRVVALWMMIFGGLAPLGILIQGSLSELFGIQPVLAVSALALAGVVGWMALRRRFHHLDATPVLADAQPRPADQPQPTPHHSEIVSRTGAIAPETPAISAVSVTEGAAQAVMPKRSRP